MEAASPAPFTTVLDLTAGVLEPERKLIERRLGDMQGLTGARGAS